MSLLWSVRWNKRLLLGNNNLLFRLTDHNNDLLFHLSDFLESIQLKNTVIMKNCEITCTCQQNEQHIQGVIFLGYKFILVGFK